MKQTEFSEIYESVINIARRMTNLNDINHYVAHLYQETDEKYRVDRQPLCKKYIEWKKRCEMKTLNREVKEKLWRNRSAGEIIIDGFFTGCTDAALVFTTLSRAKGIDADYVESVEEKYLKRMRGNSFLSKIYRVMSNYLPFPGHVFVDVYQNGECVSYNPGCGEIKKDGEVYLWSSRKKRYVEVARGVDFSFLFTSCSTNPIELRKFEQLKALVLKS